MPEKDAPSTQDSHAVSLTEVAATKPRPAPHVRAVLIVLHAPCPVSSEYVLLPSHATQEVSDERVAATKPRPKPHVRPVLTVRHGD